MRVKVGTFNLNNLFSRFNFSAEVGEEDGVEIESGPPSASTEGLNERRTKRLFTVYNTHLKSHFVPFGQDPVAGAAAADERRRQQADALARIVSSRMRPNSTFLVVDDMNDAPDAEPLAPLPSKLALTDSLEHAVEDRPAPEDDPPAPDRPWTHRFKPARKPAHYQLFDHVWLSDSAAQRKAAAGINRRTRLGATGATTTLLHTHAASEIPYLKLQPCYRVWLQCLRVQGQSPRLQR